MARLRSSSLNIRWQSFRLRSAAGGFDALWSPEGRGTFHRPPGCLTSESEERETWTAESLRAGALRQSLAEERPDETSAVDVSGQHLIADMHVTRVTCDG